MAPQSENVEDSDVTKELPIKPSLKAPRKFKIAYRPVITFSYIHLAALYGLYLVFTKAKWQSILFYFLLYVVAEIGITAGVHRLWSHRSYKAKMPLQIILLILNTLAYQDTVASWVRDHRQHHKYCDTDGDPHNARRGFFYSHIGWLITKKSDEVIKCGKTIDMTDIYNNPVLKFQKKYAIPLFTTVCFVLPTAAPAYFWGESYYTAWCLNMLRYAMNLNASFLVNSAAHMWGFKPYDKTILPTENIGVSFMALGEGFHNYHHVFPWDYQASELGNSVLNLTTWFIDFFAWIGWAYDLKKVPESVIRNREKRTGDGTNRWAIDDENVMYGNKSE